MKAAVLNRFGAPLILTTVAEPLAGAGEAVIDVVAAPVISYAREVFSNERQYPLELPIVPGCGAIGRIREVGPDATRLQPGQWVFCDPTVRSRDDPVSPDLMLQGWNAHGRGAAILQRHFHDGPFAERIRVPIENAVPIGDISPADAATWTALNTLLVPYGGLLASGLEAGETVLVSGATGHFGSAAVMVALAMGAARVVAAGRNEMALDDLLRRFGPRVHPVRLSGDSSTDTERMRGAGAGTIDRMLDLLPPLTDASPVRAAIMAVRSHGCAVLMGGLGADLALPYRHVMRGGITVRGQWMYPRQAPRKLVALIRANAIDLKHFQVRTFVLDEVQKAVDHAAKHAGPFKLCVVTNESRDTSALGTD